MTANAWMLALLVASRGGWCTETLALLEVFTADLAAGSTHPNRPVPRA